MTNIRTRISEIRNEHGNRIHPRLCPIIFAQFPYWVDVWSTEPDAMSNAIAWCWENIGENGLRFSDGGMDKACQEDLDLTALWFSWWNIIAIRRQTDATAFKLVFG